MSKAISGLSRGGKTHYILSETDKVRARSLEKIPSFVCTSGNPETDPPFYKKAICPGESKRPLPGILDCRAGFASRAHGVRAVLSPRTWAASPHSACSTELQWLPARLGPARPGPFYILSTSGPPRPRHAHHESPFYKKASLGPRPHCPTRQKVRWLPVPPPWVESATSPVPPTRVRYEIVNLFAS